MTTIIEVKVDAIKLRQVITNLVNNAIKYTNEGYVTFGYEVEEKEDFDIDYILVSEKYITNYIRYVKTKISKLEVSLSDDANTEMQCLIYHLKNEYGIEYVSKRKIALEKHFIMIVLESRQAKFLALDYLSFLVSDFVQVLANLAIVYAQNVMALVQLEIFNQRHCIFFV